MNRHLTLIDQALSASDKIVDTASCHQKARDDVRLVMDRLIVELDREDGWSRAMDKAYRMEGAA